MSYYKIKKSDINYIRALTKYCKDVPILTIEEDDRQTVRKVDKKNLTCKDLPAIVKGVEGDEFVITCADYLMLEHVFPTVDTAQLVAATSVISNEEMSILEKNILDAFFEHETYKGPKAYMPPEYFSDKLKQARPNLTKTEAILLLQQIDEKYKVTNTFLLQDEETFIFQVDHTAYYLGYGQHTGFDSLENLMFDIDDGFRVPSWPPGNAEKFAFITDPLNARFQQWKASGYLNDLFTADQSGLVQMIDARPIMQAGSFGVFAPAGGVAQAPEEQKDEMPENRFGY